MTLGASAPPTDAQVGWGVSTRRYPFAKRLVLFALLLVPALPVGIVGFLFWGFAGLIVSTIVAAAFLVVWALALRPVLRPLRPRPPHPGEAHRFLNLIEGLSRDVGREVPRLAVIDRAEPNAYVARRLGSDTIAVTSGLLETYARTEQEAVAAHCVVRLARVHMIYPMIAAALGKWAYSFAPTVGQADDLETISITRYPPALVAAISKAEGPLSEAPLAFSSLAACHEPASRRTAAVTDL